MTRKTLISLVLSLAAVTVLVAGSFLARGLRAPVVEEIPGMTVLSPAAPLPEFTLVDHLGRPFERERLKGKWTFLFFGYTHCPDVCPTTMVVLRDVQKQVGGNERGVQYVFVSVDPDRDNAATLKRYVPYFHPEFIGATGGMGELMRLTRALGAYFERGESRNGGYEVHHSAAIFLIDPERRLRALFAGPHDSAVLARGLQSLKGD
jgi:protein SCO1/2